MDIKQAIKYQTAEGVDWRERERGRKRHTPTLRERVIKRGRERENKRRKRFDEKLKKSDIKKERRCLT